MATTRDPALVWNPLPEHDSQPAIVPIQWIVHTFVDSPSMNIDKMQDYFEFSTPLESHTLLGWFEHQQLMDFDRRADANYRANRFEVGGAWCGAISTETEDDGDPLEKPWNAYQLGELIRFGTWLSRTFGIPPFPPTWWNAPGMGWHCLYPDDWTNQPGKLCPGHRRIAQFTGIVLPAIRANLAVKPKPPILLEDDMPLVVIRNAAGGGTSRLLFEGGKMYDASGDRIALTATTPTMGADDGMWADLIREHGGASAIIR